jgi:thymidylate synthase ThyX
MSHACFIVDDQQPEDLAMLQALYSRSPASVVTHLDKLAKSGSGKFMDQYYVGYGHASIGDCGVTTCFIEQVSMLVAKAVQDNPLYSGQEASTRYLDFSQQAVVDPYDTPQSRAIQSRWQEIYAATLPKLQEAIKAAHPFDPADYKSERIWANTLNARAFDVARSLLPIGTTTLLSWTTSLRQARDNLRRLKHHPLPEVREVADALFAKLRDQYPHSFRGDEMDRATETPRDAAAKARAVATHYLCAEDAVRRFALGAGDLERLGKGEMIVDRRCFDADGLRANETDELAARAVGAPLPWRLESYGRYNFLFLLDFGSFRDIQRHRNGVCQIPLVTGRFGMHPWYRDQFDALLGAEDAKHLDDSCNEQYAALEQLCDQGIKTQDVMNQYYLPMGQRGLVQASYSLPQTLYVAELRSAKTVHPSLRPVAQQMLAVLEHDFPGLALAGDRDVDSWTAKRGEQTIAKVA